MSANRRFLELVFADALPATHTIITAFRGDPYKADRSAWAGRPWRPGGHVPGWFDTANSYLTVSTFEPDPETGELRRRKTNFSSMRVVLIDDVGTKVAAGKLQLAPSALIETSPGNCQASYFITQDADARDRAKCELLIDAMIRGGLSANGTDPGMKGVTRYARLPVGINGKSKYVAKLGAPFRVRMLECEPTRRYTLAEIAAAWHLELAPPAARSSVTLTPDQITRLDAQFAALVEALNALGLYRGRIGRGSWHEITCPWISEHTDRADSGTAISEPGPDNNYAGGFRCHHGHGDKLHLADVRRFLGTVMREIRREAAA